MHENMKKLLEEYEKACCEEWSVRDAKSEAKAKMDRLCAKERRTLRHKVKRIMREARPGWSLVYDGHDCHASISHIRPMTAHVSVSVRLLYCAGRLRGEVRLYGDFEELDALLEELRRTVTAKARGEVREGA
jgi:hypothetical protein